MQPVHLGAADLAVFARGLLRLGGLRLLGLILAHDMSIRTRWARDTRYCWARDTRYFSRAAGGRLSLRGGTGGDPRRGPRSGS